MNLSNLGFRCLFFRHLVMPAKKKAASHKNKPPGSAGRDNVDADTMAAVDSAGAPGKELSAYLGRYSLLVRAGNTVSDKSSHPSLPVGLVWGSATFDRTGNPYDGFMLYANERAGDRTRIFMWTPQELINYLTYVAPMPCTCRRDAMPLRTSPTSRAHAGPPWPVHGPLHACLPLQFPPGEDLGVQERGVD